MNFRHLLCAATAIVVSVSFSSLAHEGATGVVKERMDLMESMGKQLKEIGQRIQTNRNLPSIRDHAQAISALSEKITALFPPGSLDRPTDAKTAIWEKWPQFEAHAQDLKKASAALADMAPSGDPKRVSDSFKAVSRSCAACHDDFRQKRKGRP